MIDMSSAPYCYDGRKCFAASQYRGRRICRILTTTYEKDGECPFCKEKNERNHKKTSAADDQADHGRK